MDHCHKVAVSSQTAFSFFNNKFFLRLFKSAIVSQGITKKELNQGQISIIK